MVQFRPFKALTPAPDLDASLAAPPYDVVTREQVREFLGEHPRSLLQVTRADGVTPFEWDSYDDRVYEESRRRFRLFLENGWLRPQEQESFYIYRQTAHGHTQTGVAGLCSVSDYQAGRIKRHEKTRAAKVTDRTRVSRSCRANLEPVFLTCKPPTGFKECLARWCDSHSPSVAFECWQGISHSVWPVNDPQTLDQIRSSLGSLASVYIADGHHRSESAARTAQALDPSADPGFLAIIFPGQDLRILGYHRIVKTLGSLSSRDLLDKINTGWEMASLPGDKPWFPSRSGEIGMGLQDAWYRLRPRETRSDLPQNLTLDAAVLQTNLLEPFLGIQDPRTDERLGFVGGPAAPENIQKALASGRAQAAFTLFPVTVETLMAVADTGGLMPPKSTWFEPKLLSGLFIQSLEL